MSSHCGGEPFALRVLGDSMAPEFLEGHIIIIEPDGAINNGDYVFAVDDKDEYIFRQLQIENNRYFLKALNKDYPTLETSLEKIKGVITQRAGKRRKEHKNY